MSLSSSEVIALGNKHLLQNVNRQPLVLVKGQGTKVWDAEGREYLDFLAGIATCAFGHCPPFAAEVLAKQAATLWHVSNVFWNEPMVKLAELLTTASGLSRAFFCNSGAEANEAAIKMARKYSYDRHGPGRHVIISAENSFHGRTMGAISATGQTRLHEGFQPMLPTFVFAPYGDLAALDSMLDQTVCAVLLETVQGEGGVVVPPPGYLAGAKRLCQERGALLILDEIQCGLGRTGEDFAFRSEGLVPDIMTLGKALGCGYPIGALLATERAAEALTPGSHSTTVGGAPLAMALGLELVSRILAPEFLEAVRAKSRRLIEGLSALKAKHGGLVSEVRGRGLMLALALTRPAASLGADLKERGFLVNVTAGSVIRLVPPLTVETAEIDALLAALDQALGAMED
jgi:predicted acetylornithine/succinylornithine family transaminase